MTSLVNKLSINKSLKEVDNTVYFVFVDDDGLSIENATPEDVIIPKESNILYTYFFFYKI
ncbi:MAG: hypothetical protein KAJ22_00085 [Candidatus Izimaplasma sp.]|nr:hypothetical protein [Candidatus Izimaplasma bacterium]